MPESSRQVFVLIGTDFQEQAVVDCLCAFRREGIKTQLVGLAAQPLSGFHGVQLKPDLSLTQLETHHQRIPSERYAILIASSSSMATAFKIDPRLFQLVHRCIQRNSIIALLSPFNDLMASFALSQLESCTHLLLQQDISAVDFSQEIVKQLYRL